MVITKVLSNNLMTPAISFSATPNGKKSRDYHTGLD